MAYPEPTPVLKGKAAQNLLEELKDSESVGKATGRWNGSIATYDRLRPKRSTG
jgi:hypothetical protein